MLVTDAEQRAALAVVRSLGRAGYDVVACSSRARPLAGASRHCRRAARVSDPLRDPTRFVDDVHALAAAEGTDILLPITDAAMLALLPERARFGSTLLPGPDIDAFLRISDKALVMEVARACGIAVPSQITVPAGEVERCLADPQLGYPVVVKPVRSVVGGHGGRKLSVAHASDHRQLAKHLRALPREAFPVLVQQRVVGPGVGIFVLRWNEEVAAVFAHERIREKPPSGGISVYRASVAAEPDLVARSSRLLEKFDWQGVAMVEYKVDERTGVPYLMEVNGRFWGSLQLAIDAGVDFPKLLVAAARGEPVSFPAYSVGIRSRWWWGDVDHLLARVRRSSEALALPPGSPGKLRAIADFLRTRAIDREEIFHLDDPGPFLRETIDWVRGQ